MVISRALGDDNQVKYLFYQTAFLNKYVSQLI